MITQEEIPFTQEEYKAMVKTIQQLRREKKELIDKACEWLKLHTFIFESIEEIDLFHQLFRKAMEE